MVCNSKVFWDVMLCLWIVADVSKDSIPFVLKVKPSKNGSDAEDKPNIPENFNLEHHCENLPPRKRSELFCITEFTNWFKCFEVDNAGVCVFCRNLGAISKF